MDFSGFFKKSFYLFLIFTILLTFLIVTGAINKGIWAAWAGLITAFLNSVAGAAIISWGYGRSEKEFYSAFFGGMIVRFALIFLVLFVLIKIAGLHQAVLVISLLLSYFSYLILELWEINKYASVRGKKG